MTSPAQPDPSELERGFIALVGLRILYASDLEWETGIPD